MSMDLVHGRRWMGVNTLFWYDLLALGLQYGWKPMGVGPPAGTPKAKWRSPDNYYGNDGQRFYARDARALASALEQALKAYRRGEKQRRDRVAGPADDLFAGAAGQRAPRRGRVPVRPLDAARVKEIRKFIRFFRAGGFRIY